MQQQKIFILYNYNFACHKTRHYNFDLLVRAIFSLSPHSDLKQTDQERTNETTNKAKKYTYPYL